MSQEGKKDHQGQHPPEPLPVHTATIQKARSVHLHQTWDRETEKQLLSQDHQTAKQQSLTSEAAAYIETQSLATLKNGSLVTLNNAILIMLTLLISYVYTVFYTIFCTLHSAITHPYTVVVGSLHTP